MKRSAERCTQDRACKAGRLLCRAWYAALSNALDNGGSKAWDAAERAGKIIDTHIKRCRD